VSEILPIRPAGPPQEQERTFYVDPTRGEVATRRAWEQRAAQWRARELAERVFGGEVTARLTGRSGARPFRGLLHMEVPFADLESHRALETVFLASAARDPLLSEVPFVFVLAPSLR